MRADTAMSVNRELRARGHDNVSYCVTSYLQVNFDKSVQGRWSSIPILTAFKILCTRSKM